MKKLLFLLAIGIGYCTHIYGQLTIEHNAIRQGDELIKYQVDYKDPGDSGTKIIWDFSNLKTINEEYTVVYSDAPLVGDSVYVLGYHEFSKKDNSIKAENLLVATEHNTMYYYMQRNDSLLLLGHENPVVKLQYKEPYVMSVYPVNFGKTVYSSYSTQGKYSGTEPIATNGEVETIADAFGMMILPDGDTISPVLRVKTSQTIIDQIKNENMETVTDQKVLETYCWYTKGYRYPIFETVRNINLADSTMLFGTSFFFPPQDHYYLETDPENQKLLNELWDVKDEQIIQADAKEDDLPKLEDYITYKIYPNPVDTELNIAYTMKEDATVNFELYYMGGALARKIERLNQSIGDHSETINCSGLMQGNYVLRITVNNTFENEKILKR